MTQPFRPLPRCLAGIALASSLTAWAAQPAPAFKPDLARGEAVAKAVCVSCHSIDGSRGSPANPIIQGQHAGYVHKQLVEFKAGKRRNPIMQGIAATLTEDDMRHVAAFYATRTAKPGFAKSKESVLLGEQIHRGGIPDRNVPACAGCHSPNGAGVPSQYPRVSGQHADYIEAQMVAFRNGTRANSPIMSDVASKMNDREIKATADYLAGLR